MSGRPMSGDCTLATTNFTCMVMLPMTNVASFQPVMLRPSPVTVTYCFLACSDVVVVCTCGQNDCGQTETAAPESNIMAQNSLYVFGVFSLMSITAPTL
eukprot:5619245-Amphidinium_carterae.1